jgi:hypothetical protein
MGAWVELMRFYAREESKEATRHGTTIPKHLNKWNGFLSLCPFSHHTFGISYAIVISHVCIFVALGI